MDAGQRGEALKHADAALALDPAYLAAQTLRERIVASGGTIAPRPVVPPTAAAAGPAVSARPAVAPTSQRSIPARPRAAAIQPSIATRASVVPPAPLPAPAPPRSSHALTQFEARARQRRLERRVAAAQHSLAAGQLGDARAALEEIR